MEYKVGDKVIVKSWDELVNEFGVDNNGYIKILNSYHWKSLNDNTIPNNRIITITHKDEDGDYWFNSVYKLDKYCVPKELIKCHANEYYLQQIKEEL